MAGVQNPANSDPNERLAVLTIYGTAWPEVIEFQGQQQLVESSWLPVRMLPAVEEALLAAGVKLGPVVDDDPLFREAELPAGWSRQASGRDPVFSYLLDGSGRRRFKVFYKASPHDRKAHVSLAGC